MTLSTCVVALVTLYQRSSDDGAPYLEVTDAAKISWQLPWRKVNRYAQYHADRGKRTINNLWDAQEHRRKVVDPDCIAADTNDSMGVNGT